MDRLEIYNMALDVLNIEPLEKEELEADQKDPIVKTLDRFFGTALRKASREHCWSFLTEKIVLGNDLGSGKGYLHSYELPDDLFRLVYAEGGEYERVGNILFTNGSPTIHAMSMRKMKNGNYTFGVDGTIPEDFWELVAYALAFLVSPRLSSGDSKIQVISSIYNTILQTMVDNDVKNEIHPVDRSEFEGENIYE